MSPCTIAAGGLSDEQLIALVEKIGAHSPRLMVSRKQYEMLMEKMEPAPEGGWRRKEVSVH